MSIGFGIVGLGMIANVHARALQETSNAKLVACCSRSNQKATEFAKKYNCEGYHSLHDFLLAPEVEVVSIATPSGAHMEPALAAIEAGKHIIIEKPLEITRERCERILEAAERRGVLVAGIFQSRFSKVSQLIKHAIKSGRLGRVVLGDAYVKWYRNQRYYDEGGWHGTKLLDGGGTLMNQSIHAVDLLQWFMGRATRVFGIKATLGHLNIEVEDTATAVIQFANGALGTIEGSTAAYPGFPKQVEIHGTTGSVASLQDRLETWSFMKETAADVTIRKEWGRGNSSSGGASDPTDIGISGHLSQFEDLANAITEDKTPAIDGTEACKAINLILAIYESAKSGNPVEV